MQMTHSDGAPPPRRYTPRRPEALAKTGTEPAGTRTRDPVIKSHMLYQLSYTGVARMERETGIEPATNSLEGCDSTIELLPPG